jgi:hypothetical protein
LVVRFVRVIRVSRVSGVSPGSRTVHVISKKYNMMFVKHAPRYGRGSYTLLDVRCYAVTLLHCYAVALSMRK